MNNNLIHDLESEIEVSVVIPMYNVENLIGEMINCLKKNTCSFEVVLVDDGSSDMTLTSARKAIGNDPRFIIITQENKGVSSARNHGLTKTRGEYITFVDSDDLLADFTLDMLLNAAKQKGADYVYGGIKKFNSHKTWAIAIHEKYFTFSEGYKEILQNPELYYSMGPAGKLISRHLITKGFPEDISCAEDQLFFFEILNKAQRIYSLGVDIYFYRERDIELNERSITQQRDQKAYVYFMDIIKVMYLAKSYNDNLKLSDDVKNRNLSNYYERAITFDVWPLLIRVLKFHPKKSSLVFLVLKDFLDSLDDTFISRTPAFRYFFIRMLADYIYLIKGARAFHSYRAFIGLLFDKLSEDIHILCSKENVYGKRWSDSYYLSKSSYLKSWCYLLYLRPKKKFFHNFNRKKHEWIKRAFFPIFKMFGVRSNKIVFATNKKGKCSSNFETVLTQLNKQDRNYDVKKFLGSTDKLTTIFTRYYHLATAKVIFLEDYYNPIYGLKFNGKTKIVQLWHACGCFKKFGLAASGKNDSNSEFFELRAHGAYTNVIGSSTIVANTYSMSFGLEDDKALGIGVPRTDLFFNERKMDRIKKSISQQYPALKNKYIVLYAPTFRGGPQERKHYKIPFDYELMTGLPDDYHLVIKLHPIVDVNSIKVPEEYKDRVTLLKSSDDVNKWMIFCDLLVTDYSSIIFEYSLLNKPIVYFPYDIDKYYDERGFYYAYEKYVYGDVALSSYELVKAIRSGCRNMRFYQENKKEFLLEFMSACDGQVAEKLLKHVL